MVLRILCLSPALFPAQTTNQAPVLPTAPVTGSNKIVIARSSDGSPQLIHARQPPILTPISHPHVEIDVKQSSLKTPLGLNGFTGTKKGLLLSSTNGNGVKLSANGLADPIGQTGSSSLAATWPAPKFQSNGGSVSTQNGPVVSGTPVSSSELRLWCVCMWCVCMWCIWCVCVVCL